jgi:hypothetical protein
MTLNNALQIFKSAGIKVMPIPGTSKYNLTLANGKMAIVKGSQLLGLAIKLGGNPDDLNEAIMKAI